MKALDLTGQRFGKLTVISKLPAKKGKTNWECECDCGGKGVFVTGNLRSGDSKSCGCLLKEMTPSRLTHGHNGKGKRTRTYSIWAGVVSRCTNPNAKDYAFYGARGVRVCEEWRDFSRFLADMGEAAPGMTIDRIDPSLGYEPSNCQWLSHSDNCRKAAIARWDRQRNGVAT